MASKSEELLDGDDTEGILAVVDNDILAEPNDLETEFAATVSKIQDINSESCFLCRNWRKTYKKRGLNRHLSAEHGDYTKTYEGRLPLDTFEQFLTTSKVNLAFVIDKKCIKNVRCLIFQRRCLEIFSCILQMYFRCRKSFWWKFKRTCLIAVGICTIKSCFGLFIWWISWKKLNWPFQI